MNPADWTSEKILGFDLSTLILWGTSILAGLLISVFFYRRQRKSADSAGAERARRAREELRGFVESYVIAGQDVTSEFVETLISATERDLEVDLSRAVTPVSLLQDVALRIQRSRHLTTQQKLDYANRIDGDLKEVLSLPHRPVRGIEELLTAAEDAAARGDNLEVRSVLGRLREATATLAISPVRMRQRSREAYAVLLALLAVVTAAAAVVAMPTPQSGGSQWPLIAGTMAVVIASTTAMVAIAIPLGLDSLRFGKSGISVRFENKPTSGSSSELASDSERAATDQGSGDA